MPSQLGSVSLGQNTSALVTLQTAQTGNANGIAFDATGFGKGVIEVVESNVGTATLTVEGSYDGGTNWYALWTAPQAANGRTYVGTIAVSQNSKVVSVLQDLAPLVRVRTSSNTGNVTVRLYANPV